MAYGSTSPQLQLMPALKVPQIDGDQLKLLDSVLVRS